MGKWLCFAIAAAGICACSSTPQQAPVADATPVNPTAVLETQVSSGGIMGAFPFETTEKRYVRANMRRQDHSTRGTGTLSGLLVTQMTGRGDTSIARLDRKVRWTLNHGKREYTECPVQGCPRPADAKERPAEERQRAEPKQQAESGCTMRIANSSFAVKPTGAKKAINGFDTEQYQVAWLVTMQDSARRKTISTLNIDLWTSLPTADMRRAMNFEESFDRAYLAAAAQPRPGAGGARAQAQVLPPDVSRMMLGYLSGLSAADRAAFVKAGRQLEQIKGHPISTRIEWSLEGDACAPKEGESAATQPASGGVLAGLSGLFGSKKEEAAKSGAAKPILSFAVEVKSLKVEPVHDSFFAVPSNYKLAKQ